MCEVTSHPQDVRVGDGIISQGGFVVLISFLTDVRGPSREGTSDKADLEEITVLPLTRWFERKGEVLEASEDAPDLVR